jgi:heme-degrading monooxygenase HmoA
VSVVKINAISVPAERGEEMAERFAARIGEVDKMEGFEEFQLLRPADDRTTWLVYTRWRDEEAFQAWVSSAAFTRGHARPQGEGGPVASHSELWEFTLAQHTEAAAG